MGFVENVNTLATSLTTENVENIEIVAANAGNIATVAANTDDVNTVADNIADVNEVVLQIVPNLAEILLADDNAATATAQAVIATAKAGEASVSATNAQLRVWEAEAHRLTADSYATEAEDVFVKVYTSNGDGTFTSTNTTDYSAYHWERKATSLVTSGAIDDTSPQIDRVYSSSKTEDLLATKIAQDIINYDSAVKLYAGGMRKSWTKGITGFTGAIRIELVNLFTFSMDGMMQIRIKETNSTAIKLDISGRWNASTSWGAYSVVSDSSINVRFARDAGKVYLLIGDISTVWGNTRLEIDNVLTNYNAGQLLSFSISTLSSLSGYTVDAIVNGQRSELLVAKTSATGSMYVPTGTTAERVAFEGAMRFNEDTAKFEGYNGSAWSSVGGGATGGGSDEVFIDNSYTITADYTIPTGKSAVTVGDASGNVTINSGVTVTLESNSRWVVL